MLCRCKLSPSGKVSKTRWFFRRFKSCVISLIVKFKYTLFYLFIILILQSYVISQLTFTNQEPLLWSIIKFDNENISMMPSLVVFLINLSILFSLYFCIFLYSWLKAGKYLDLSYIFKTKPCSCTVLMPTSAYEVSMFLTDGN